MKNIPLLDYFAHLVEVIADLTCVILLRETGRDSWHCLIFVHTAAKVRNKTVIRHISMPFIPEICKNMLFSLSLHSEMINLTELRNEYVHETKNSYRRSFCCSQPVEARYVVGHSSSAAWISRIKS